MSDSVRSRGRRLFPVGYVPPSGPVPCLLSSPEPIDVGDAPLKAVPVRWSQGERVRERHHDRRAGTVTAIHVHPGCILYDVELDDGGRAEGYACEWEDAT